MKNALFSLLLTTTFLSTSAMAQTVSEMNVTYLNSLTSPNITWQEVSVSGANTVEINGKYYQYTYNNSGNYAETLERIDDTILTSDVTDVLFKGIYGNMYGGAVYNTYSDFEINIIADFIYNYAYANMYHYSPLGGAIYNSGAINSIYGSFIGNHALHEGGNSNYGNNSYGGAIYNVGTITSIVADFVGNYATNPSKSAYSFSEGGAIKNTGRIDSITGNFIGNYTSHYTPAEYSWTIGGAISMGSPFGSGSGSIGAITGDFIGNYVYSYRAVAEGGAVFVGGTTIESITGDFIGNYAKSDGTDAVGGAIANVDGIIEHVVGNFINNYTFTTSASSEFAGGGGAISNGGTMKVSGDFISNYAKTNSTIDTISSGGAVWNSDIITFASENDTYYFTGNYTQDSRGKIYNAITNGSSATAIFDTSGGGAWIVNDNIEGGNYKFSGDDAISEDGSTTQYVSMNNSIVGAESITIENTTLRFGSHKHDDKNALNWNGRGSIVASLNSDGTDNTTADSVTSLLLNNGVLDISGNGYMDVIKLRNYTSANGFIHLDVDLNNMVSDILDINGDVRGVTKLVLHTNSDKDIKDQGSILFAKSINDSRGHSGSFVVSRVYGNPYMFYVTHDSPTTSTNNWYVGMNEPEKDDDSENTPSSTEDIYNTDNSANDSTLVMNPTLDTIKSEGNNLTGNYELIALGTEALPEGAEKVIIDGAEYYFTPSGENADLLKNLAHTPALNLVESENGIFSFGGKKYSYDISQIPDSSFYYDSSDVVMKNDRIFLSDRITVTPVEKDGDNTFAISSYDGNIQYYKYDHNSDGRKTYVQRITVSDSVDADFKYISSYITAPSNNNVINGGVITLEDAVDSITGDFIDNTTEVIPSASSYSTLTVNGGAIYNESGIGKIVGNFIENSVVTTYGNIYGGAIYNNSNIDEIKGSFVANHIDASNSASGGVIYNNGSIGNITGHFIGNYTQSETGTADSGALANNGIIGDITGDFIGNYSFSQNGGASISGAIMNGGSINSITGDFIGNYTKGAEGQILSGLGGTMTNAGYIGAITGDFVDNHASIGGAIADLSFLLKLIGSIDGSEVPEVGIQSIKGNFINNSADYAGGAIASLGVMESIEGNFINNKVKSTSVGFGGAIATVLGSDLKNIKSDFKNNGVDAVMYANGGAFTNANIVDQLRVDETSDFINTVSNIKGSMTDNYAIASGENGIALGGGIYSLSSINLTSEGKSQQISGNYIKDSTGKQYNAIFASNVYDLLVGLLSQDEETMSQIKMFTGLEEFKPIISVNTLNGGNWTINDSISGGVDGTLLTTIMTLIEGLAGEEIPELPITIPTKTDYSAQYVLNFIGNDTIDTELGTTTQYINMNNAIVNAGKVNVENTTLRFGAYQHKDKSAKNWDAKGKIIAALNDDGSENLDVASVTSLTLNNAVFDISNGYMETVKLKNYSATDSFVHLDVDVENMTSDVINVKGDVDGITKLVIHASSDKDIRGQGKILFAESFGDTKGGKTSFEVARVYKSPYLYDVVYEGVENTTTETTSKDNTWFFEMNDKENPNKDKTPVVPTPVQPLGPIEVAPEVVATVAVKTAGLSQTNGMVYNIMRKVGVNRLFCPGCGFYDYNWDGEAFHNLWVDTTYNGLTIEAPVEIDAKVWGIEAGSDLQHDLNNKLGIFVSYRQGNYEMDGKGEKYYSNIGSEIDIDSYLVGLYYRYDYNDWYAFATVYGGMQNAEIQTDDGVANYDTDGIEFGGSIEAGYNYALTRKLSVTPSLGAFYSQISYDDATDNVGKTVNYNDLKQVELEAGAKFAYTQYTDDGFYSLYVKPSVVQTLVDGDEIEVTKLGKVDTVEDKTLGRVELGGNIGFNENWSAYGWANYTFGSDYEATSLGLGLNYAW